MKTLTITEFRKKVGSLKDILDEHGEARIVWNEPKPGGKVTLSAIIKVEKGKNYEF